ncbi:MAG: hypothetical protein V4760_15730 [Bdellovibrionota bacterium]
MARVTNRVDKKDLQPGVKAQTLDKMSQAAQEAAAGGEKRTHEDRLDPMRDHVPGHLGYTRANLDTVIAPGPNPVSKSNIGLKEQPKEAPKEVAPVQVRDAAPKKKKPVLATAKRAAPKRVAAKKASPKMSASKKTAAKKSASGRASTSSKSSSKKRNIKMRAQQTSSKSVAKSASGMITKKIAGARKAGGTATGRKVSAAGKAGRKSAARTGAKSTSTSTRSRRTTGSRRATMH